MYAFEDAGGEQALTCRKGQLGGERKLGSLWLKVCWTAVSV